MYKNEILSLFDKGMCIGFICRRSVVYGITQGIENGWIATQSMHEPKWKGNFPTRKAAREYLEGLVHG